MSEDEINPQLYLITPPSFNLGSFSEQLTAVLDGAEIACVRLNMASDDVDEISRAADGLREICHARDIPIVIEGHVKLVQPLGLDGVHLIDSSKSVREARKELGDDAVIGCYCGASKHAGMTAGEIGADYVSFGPVAESALGNEKQAPHDLFDWWIKFVEVPVVAEGELDLERAASLAKSVDFLALGKEIWNAPNPVTETQAYLRAIS